MRPEHLPPFELQKKGEPEKPWEIEFGFNNESFRKLISLINQGIEKKDIHGNSISQSDAEYMLAIGVLGLRKLTTLTINPDLIEKAKNLIEANGTKVDSYIAQCLEKRVSHREKHFTGDYFTEKDETILPDEKFFPLLMRWEPDFNKWAKVVKVGFSPSKKQSTENKLV